MPSASVDVDTSLLAGLAFGCRPDCGLCCYATPRVSPAEQGRLIRIDPTIPFRDSGAGLPCIADRGDGGACYLLSDRRCRAHDARPFPCREFPLSVHVGRRVQVTAVFSCPGIEPAGLLEWAGSVRTPRPPQGFERELEAVAAHLASQPVARWIADSGRRMLRCSRRLETNGLWDAPAEIAGSLGPRLLGLVRDRFEPPEPPERSDGVAGLPMFWDADRGLVALASHPAGWELLSLAESGLEAETLTVVPVPDRCPTMDRSAERAVLAYLRYLLARDSTYWQAAFQVDPDGDVRLIDEVAADLSEFGSLVLARAVARRRLRGLAPEPLDLPAVLDGIRATDAEFIDRPTLGLRL